MQSAVHLVGVGIECYCPGDLDSTDPSPPPSLASLPPPGSIPPLPLPPLPMGAAPYLQYYPAFAGYGPPKPRVWTVFVTFIAALVAFIVVNVIGGAVAAAIVLHGREDIRTPQEFLNAVPEVLAHPWALMSLGLAGQLALLASAVIAAIVSPVPFVKRLRLTPSTLPILGYPLVMLGALAIGILYSQVIALLHLKPEGALKIFDELLRHLTPAQTVAAVLILGVMPGFAEEWLFRGYIQTRLSRAWGRWPAIVTAALLFGVMHMDLWQSPFASLFGIYLGYVAEKSGGIRPTMICHIFNNSTQILFATVFARYVTPPLELGIVIVCLVALPFAIVYLRFGVHPPAERDDAAEPLALPVSTSFPQPAVAP